MRDKILFIFAILFLIPLTSCSQKDQSFDQLFFEVKGPVKTMRVFNDYSHGEGSEMYHFSKKGELEKIEHFNLFKENEEVKIGNVTYFKNQEGNTRYFYQTESGSGKIVESFSIQLSSKNQIDYKFETTNKDVKVEKVIDYNKLGNPVKSILKGYFYNDSTHLKREHFYDQNNRIKSMKLTNYVLKTTEIIEVKNAVYDKYGNATSAEYHDKDGKVIYHLKCEFSYY